MKRMFFLGFASLLLFSCKKDVDDSKVFKGATVQVYNGKAWSWISLSKKNVPEQLGITIEDAALNSVPLGDGHDGHNHNENNFVLPLHPKAIESTPFKTAVMDWAPQGHPPANVYDKPHFDFHYYMMTAAEVAAATDPVKLEAVPHADYLPENYIGIDPVPQMGKHWVDVTAPELHPTDPQPFTQTFIYGTYDGRVNFYEPMITLDFLKNTTHFERNIPQPKKFRETGYYPTKMRVIKHGGKTEVVLDGFVHRTAS